MNICLLSVGCIKFIVHSLMRGAAETKELITSARRVSLFPSIDVLMPNSASDIVMYMLEDGSLEEYKSYENVRIFSSQ